MSWIQTYTGVVFDLLEPHPDLVRLEDIAHAESQLCRFAGHVREFYSVAEHSIHCSRIAEDFGYSLNTQRLCLLHDATEVYAADLPRPVKLLPGLNEEYMRLEERIERVVFERFDLIETADDIECWNRMKDIDYRICETERRELMLPVQSLYPAPRSWGDPISPIKWKLACWSPTEAKAEFLNRAEELGLK